MSAYGKVDYEYQNILTVIVSIAWRLKIIFDNSSEPAIKR